MFVNAVDIVVAYVPGYLCLLLVVAFTWLGIFFGPQQCLPSFLLEFFARLQADS